VTSFDFDTAIDQAGVPAAERDTVRHAGRRERLAVQANIAACAQAWVNADLPGRPVSPERIGVVVGGHNLTQRYTFEQHEQLGHDLDYVLPRYALQSQDTHLVATISEALGIQGEGFTVGASSASGNAAVIMAARMIACGAADVCLAVGAMTQLDPAMYVALDKLGVLAPGAVVPGPRPLDRNRSGLVPGEAAACVVVESRRSARQRGAEPISELIGAAQALDGTALPNPSVDGESRAMAKALADASVTSGQVGYVNAHATATPAGDDAEAEAIATVFAPARPWVNATKGLIGHCLGAAGVIETVAAAIQLSDGFLHPNPRLGVPVDASLRYVGAGAIDTEIAYALSNSFGFGGFNSSIVLSQP
jgi:malonyl-ACP decarboxylase